MKTYFQIFLFLFMLLGCSQKMNEITLDEDMVVEPEQFEIEYPFQDPRLPIDERVEDLIGRLSLEEKIGQLLMNSKGIPRLGIPDYDWWNESLHGVARNGRATVFPQAIGLGATFDPELIHQMTTVISDEARAKYNLAQSRQQYGRYTGLTFWSPNVNIFRDPRWGRGQETYGEDPYLTSQIGLAYVQGLQGDDPHYLKAAALAKHYAVHNGPEANRHEFNAVVTQKDLWETYLPAFETLVIEGKVEGVMGAYNRTNGIPCCAHPYLMQEVLREQWDFKGYFVTDCWALIDFYDGHNVVETREEAAALALETGSNINCGVTYNAIQEAIDLGLTSEEAVNQNLREALPTRFKLGMFDPAGSTPWDAYGQEKVRAPEHVALSRTIAAQSMVLLKNDNQLLPLDENIDNIFVTGPMATHAQALLANYYGVSENLVTFLEGIVGNAAPHASVKYRQGVLMDIPNRNPQDWASGAARGADVTIACMGISQLLEGEEGESIASPFKGDREDIKLPENQIEYVRKLAENTDKLVVVVTAGSAVDLTEIYELADAVIFAWYPGEQGGNALADVLWGKVNPSGRLPMTFPKSVEDLPPFEDYALANRTYRYMTKEVLFPFGFGLSYTDFTYSDIEISNSNPKLGETVELSATVTNTGSLTGTETVQYYLTDNDNSVDSPLFSLKGFQKISLQPGQSQKVSFSISKKDRELVLNTGEKIEETGNFTAYIGSSLPTNRSLELGSAEWVSLEFRVIE